MGKFRTLVWFLQRPAYYNELFARVSRRLNSAKTPETDTRGEAIAWCRDRAIDT